MPIDPYHITAVKEQEMYSVPHTFVLYFTMMIWDALNKVGEKSTTITLKMSRDC